MFVNSSRLPHLLAPTCYGSPQQHAREVETIFLPLWHLVATRADLARPGDFVTCELFGRPIQVRNEDGEIRAYSNVCAHRHCLLTGLAKGNSPKLRCQYHGWEYDRCGRTGHIPQPKNFLPFDREADRLPMYRVESCGQLVFVSLNDAAPSLADYLGSFHPLIAERFSESCRQSLAWEPRYSVNWKVPVENTLEAYHVPSIHPNTFREDPGEQRSTHLLHARSTSFGTQLPFSSHSRADALFQRLEGRFLGLLGIAPTGAYWQHHVFPNLLFSFTDTLSLCHQVIPTSPTTSRALVRQFSRGNRNWPLWRRGLSAAWGRLAAGITRGILREDMRLYDDIQRGLAASPHAGTLGRCEERIHAFQKYVLESCEGKAAVCPDPFAEPAKLVDQASPDARPGFMGQTPPEACPVEGPICQHKDRTAPC
jgi:phenylpropionate dioxygenase-like ring-hydroxylating dioxygenase large terminal subunit